MHDLWGGVVASALPRGCAATKPTKIPTQRRSLGHSHVLEPEAPHPRRRSAGRQKAHGQGGGAACGRSVTGRGRNGSLRETQRPDLLGAPHQAGGCAGYGDFFENPGGSLAERFPPRRLFRGASSSPPLIPPPQPTICRSSAIPGASASRRPWMSLMKRHGRQ